MSLRSEHTVKHSCSTPRRELGSKARVSEDGKPPWTAFIVAVDGQIRRRWRDVPSSPRFMSSDLNHSQRNATGKSRVCWTHL